METLLTEVSMGLGTAFAYYFVRIVMFGAVAALGVALGIKLRKKKDNK